ncbi:MAG: PAS domain S-box protein, partial [Rubrobacteraceae bacterium]
MSTIGSQIGQFIERKHAEEALRRSEQHLRSIVTNAPVVLFALDHEGVFTLSEGKGLEALGLKSGQLVGSSALEMYREAPQITGNIHRTLAGEEFNAITEMGGLIFETWFSPVLLEESGEVAGVIGVATDVTERKKAQEERERTSRQSELILNSAGEGIFGLDRRGRTRFANPAATAMLGYESGELIDRCQHDLIHHSHPDGSTYLVEECPIYMALRDGVVHQIDDEVFWRKDGTSFPVEYTSTPILENEEVTGTVVIFSDITERKKVEEDLRKSEARLAEAQRIAHLGNWEWDTKTGRVWWSDETYRIYGLEPGELVPTLDTVMDVFHPDDRHLLRLAINRAFHEDEPYSFEHRIVRPDGEVRWIYRQVKVVRGKGEESLRLFGTVHDISEHKSVERELIEGARQAALGEDVGAALNESGDLRTILRRCTEAMVRHLDAAFARIWILNEEDNELELQASAGMYTHLDGVHSRVPVGKFKIGLIAQERRPYLTNDVLGDPRVHDKEWARQEGMVAFAGYPLVVEGRLVGVVAMFARQHLAEATLNALASVAGTIAQGIVRKQAEENLRAYAARLNRSNRDLQDFAYVASHDLQEPLRKVRTFADRLNVKYAEVLGEQGRDYLERMAGAAARMQDLIDDLLELSRVTTKAQPFTPVDLSEVAQEVLSDLEARIDQIGGRVEVSGLPTVEADRPQMRQLLQNLIGNALKFHREGKTPIIKVYGAFVQKRKEEPNRRAAHGGVCQILVEDNGIGFDEEHLERIFVPFQRLHGRTDYEGTGMGLAICRKVVERHGGDITAKSIPGRGATFVVTLPVKQSEGNP